MLMIKLHILCAKLYKLQKNIMKSYTILALIMIVDSGVIISPGKNFNKLPR